MCGIAGLVAPSLASVDLKATINAIEQSIFHRGPDSGGVWVDIEDGVALAHRRLAIVDLSDAGAQPMESHSGRYQLTYNGEIYNHLEIRRRLEDERNVPQWRGHSDTETLLAAVDAWGFELALKRCFGMFAIALWDKKLKTLTLARDRMGEKPLYYGRVGSGLAFASELKAIRCVPEFDGKLNQTAVADFLRFSYIPDPLSIYEGIHKLKPGHFVVLSAAGEMSVGEPTSYFDLQAAEGIDSAQIASNALDENIQYLKGILNKVVNDQMLSDVPLGAFLSGGIDSSLITAVMQANTSEKVKTFSIGFSGSRFDESPHALAVARYLRTDHTEFHVGDGDALALVGDLPFIFDEPFADSSQLPTILLSRLTRKHVTVAMSGDGGDELFGGYNRYVLGPKVWKRAERLPGFARRSLGFGSAIAQRLMTGGMGDRWSILASRAKLPVTTVDRLGKFGDAVANADDFEKFYRNIVSTWRDPYRLLRTGGGHQRCSHRKSPMLDMSARAEWMMEEDIKGYLPGDILVKVDRSAMSVALETRAPFLDPRIVWFSQCLPFDQKIGAGGGKLILRTMLNRYFPEELLERPKQGFSVPMDEWLRSGLKDWGGDLINRADELSQGIFDGRVADNLWQRHQSKRVNGGAELWTVLMYLNWADAQLTND